MDFYDVIEKRYSVRDYADRPIEQEKLDRILEAARLAPSAKNLQPWKFVVVRDEEMRRQLALACNGQRFIADAPVVIAGVALDPGRIMSCEVPAGPVDLAIALEHIALAATAEGLGSCWIGAFKQDQVRELLGVPEGMQVIEVITLGHPASSPPTRDRKPIDEVVCHERFA